MEKLTLTPNVPVQIALKFSDGKMVEGRFGDQVMFSLTNNQVMYLDTDVAAKIYELQIQAREPFGLCKRWTGKKGDSIQWDVWRLDQTSTTGLPPTVIDAEIATRRQTAPPVPPQHEVIPPMPPAPSVGRVIPVQHTNGAAVPTFPDRAAAPPLATQVPAFNNGNGTKPANGNGNGNGTPEGTRPYNAAGIPTPMVKVDYRVALRHILRDSLAELKAANEQWSDEARQDLVSTLMIQAFRDGMISWAALGRDGD